MRSDSANDAPRQYAAAQTAHYRSKDLRNAMESYTNIIVTHPNSREAGYSRTQIANIAHRVLSKDVLLGLLTKLTLAELSDAQDTVLVEVDLAEAIT